MFTVIIVLAAMAATILGAKGYFLAKDRLTKRSSAPTQPVSTPPASDGQKVPTCKVCEMILVGQMRKKYPLFNLAYALGHGFIRAWMWVVLPRSERTVGEDNAVRRCGTCEKVFLRRFRAKSPAFDAFYKVMDALLEGLLEKFLSEKDRDEALATDPAHARALTKFNPRSYQYGEAPIIAVKFNCVAQEVHNGSGLLIISDPIPGVREALQSLSDRGVKILVYGWRTNAAANGKPHFRAEAIKWLKKNGIPHDFFLDKGPPIADVTISRRNLGGDLLAAMPQIEEIIARGGFVKERHLV